MKLSVKPTRYQDHKICDVGCGADFIGWKVAEVREHNERHRALRALVV